MFNNIADVFIEALLRLDVLSRVNCGGAHATLLHVDAVGRLFQ